MPLPIIADVFRCTLNWFNTDTSQHAHNVIHIEDVVGPESTVYTNLDAHVTAAMWDFVCPNSVVQSVDIAKLDGFSATQHFVTGAPGKWSGQGTGTDYVPQGAGIVTAYTTKRGRSYRGRVFLPHVAEGEQTRGAMQDVAAAQAAWTAFLTAMAGTSSIPVVASYLHSTADTIQTYKVQSFMRTQRRRAR